MGRLLVSPDLTADEIPTTSGHRRFVPWTRTWRIKVMNHPRQRAPVASGSEKFVGFWPSKARKKRGGKRAFPRVLFQAFPDALHPEGLPKDAGPEAQWREAILFSRGALRLFGNAKVCLFLQRQRHIPWVTALRSFRRREVQEGHPPGAGLGARSPQRLELLE